jgi:ABC-type glutathione transport system ATPase component
MAESLLDARDVDVTFTTGHGSGRTVVKACDAVSLNVDRREIVGLVGESGSGKSTFARVVAGLQPKQGGQLWFDGAPLEDKRPQSVRRRVQMVFQDPYSSLDPRMTVQQTLSELLRFHQVVPKGQVRARCEELMDLVQLPARTLAQLPHAMSGGQRQRVAIARALALEPDLLIADEAVSALDVSVQAGVINLLADLRDELGLSILFIAHDLAVVRSFCDRTYVIYQGQIVEEGATRELFDEPHHDYTKRLLAAVPRIRGRRTERMVVPQYRRQSTANRD